MIRNVEGGTVHHDEVGHYEDVYEIDLPAHVAAAGVDTKGRLIETVGVELEGGGVLVYHAMRLTVKMAQELGLG